MAQQRIDKIIASTGRFSRREVKTLVREGRVLVDGRIAASAEEKCDPERAHIRVNGEEIGYREHTYVMLHKPAGVLSATEDGRGETVLDLLAPKKHVDKVYFVRVDGTLDEKDCAAFAAGMTLGDGLACLPARLEILSAGARSEALVTIREGKFHQIKRMLAAREKPVVYLKRLSMGPLTLDETLPKGAYRLLTEEETALLRAR